MIRRLLIVVLTMAALGAAPASQPAQRSAAEVQKLIDEAGRSRPDWWDATPLNYPKSLDLTWAAPPKGWDNQKWLGQYIWDIINPNPGRWKEGVKLLHHTLTVNKDDPSKLERSMDELARMYFDLLQDYPRAAFWAQKAHQRSTSLAYCYYRLGNKAMAVEILDDLGDDRTRNGTLIKAWSDFGELNEALRLAEEKAKNDWADAACLAAGDACRLAGQYPQALAYYRRVLEVPKGGIDLKRNKERAQANIDAIQVFDALDLSRIADGTYSGRCLAYAGPLEIALTIKAGRIENVAVTSHKEKQFYGSIANTTAGIIQKQGVKGVDATSGATITSEAILNAAAQALAQGMKSNSTNRSQP